MSRSSTAFAVAALHCCPVCRAADCGGCDDLDLRVRADGADAFFAIAQRCGDLKLAATTLWGCPVCGEVDCAEGDRAFRDALADLATLATISAQNNDPHYPPTPAAPAVARPAALALYTVAA